MKKARKLLAIVLSLAVALTMGIGISSVAFAADTGAIKITDAVTGHTYTAYQILKGDLEGSQLTNIAWGDGITAAGKAALEAKYEVSGPVQVANEIGEDNDAVAFADTVGSNVQNGKTGTLSGTDYTISGLASGYYMVVDTYTPQEGETGVTYSRYMVKVVGNETVTVKNKAEKPEVDKKIVEGSQKVEGNSANIGDEINYEITSKVPDRTGYKEYYMDFSDTLSKGLTYKAGSLEVYIGETKLTENEAYTLTVGDYSATDGTAIAIHLKDMVSRNYTTGADIKITYKATVNDAAVIGTTGNPNTVKLEYSNNPTDSGDGTPDNNNDGVQGETPDQVVKTFVAELELTKIDASTEEVLAGAVFNVEGSQINKVLITGERFVVDEAGTYYLLKDGTYTTKAPTASTEDKYASTEIKYKKEAYSNVSQQEAANTDFQVVTDANGKIKITGLKDGTYTFTEVQAPDGYNKLETPITITVESSINGTTCTWVKNASENVTVVDGTYQFTVENNSGSTLPETGGIGTTIFYILGALLVVGCGIVLIARRRLTAK